MPILMEVVHHPLLLDLQEKMDQVLIQLLQDLQVPQVKLLMVFLILRVLQ